VGSNSVDQPVEPGANDTTIDQNIQYMVEREIAATADNWPSISVM
jgi:hypothetical protein